MGRPPRNNDKLALTGDHDAFRQAENLERHDPEPMEIDKVPAQSHDNDAEGVASRSDGEGEDDQSEEEGDGTGTLGEGFYEVEAVRRKRVRRGQVQYLIKWRGWPEKANTWEPFDNVEACADIIEEFEKSSTGKQGKRGRGKRKFGTYFLPQKKKRSSSSNIDDGSSPKNNAGSEEADKEQGAEPPLVSKESPESQQYEGLPGGKPVDTGRRTSEDKSTAKDIEEAIPDCGRKNDEEVQQDLGHEPAISDAIVSPLESRDVKMDSSPNKVPWVKHSPSVPKDKDSSPSQLVAEETGNGHSALSIPDSLANGHHNVREERMQTESGCYEQQVSLTSEGAMVEKKMCTEMGVHSSSSHPEKKAMSRETGKVNGNDKCTGAKKRKQGFVRRVRQSLDTQEQDPKAVLEDEKLQDGAEVSEQGNPSKGLDLGMQEGGTADHLGGQLPKLQGHEAKTSTCTSPSSLQGSQFDTTACSSLAITKIIKAVNYSNSSANGNHDVTVLFKALRADGCEVLVDNKFMRLNYPILLIEFYEKHLRYTSSTTV